MTCSLILHFLISRFLHTWQRLFICSFDPSLLGQPSYADNWLDPNFRVHFSDEIVFKFFSMSFLLYMFFMSTILQVWPNRYKYLLDSYLDCFGPSRSAPHISSSRVLLATVLFLCLTSSHWATEMVQGIFTTTAVITSRPLCVQLVCWLSKQNDGISVYHFNMLIFPELTTLFINLINLIIKNYKFINYKSFPFPCVSSSHIPLVICLYLHPHNLYISP